MYNKKQFANNMIPRNTAAIPAFLRNRSPPPSKSLSKRYKHYLTNVRTTLIQQWKSILYTTSIVSITALLYTSYIRYYIPTQIPIDLTHNNTNTIPNPTTLSNDPIIPTYIIVKPVTSYTHDTNAFTQGLQFLGDVLYESTGLHGRSEVRMVDLFTGNVLKSVKLGDAYFGEGLAIVPTIDKTDYMIYVLTWREHRCIVYDTKFNKLNEFAYSTDGWGLTYDNKHNELILSDGTQMLYKYDPYTFQLKSTIQCTQYVSKQKQYVPIQYINELEYINGYIYANIWLTPNIAVIDSQTGIVHKYLTLDKSMQHNLEHRNRDAVPNGIAYNHTNKKLYITGKMWPKLYEIDHRPE